jgi:sugar phosphate isomerase/epimerase
MQLGFMNNPRNDPLAEARWAAVHGFECLDLTIEHPAAGPEQLEPAAIRAVLDEAGMTVVGHTAWYLPFQSPIERVRRAAVEEVAAQLPIFASVGAQVVNVHIGRAASILGEDATVELNGRSFAELAELAAPYGIRIMAEHPPDREVPLETICAILAADARLGFHLDVGHAYVARLDLAEVLATLGERLCHVHLSDNRGRNDDHMPIGAGYIDWPAALGLLKACGYDGTITLEVFDQDDHTFLLASARKVREWWAAAGVWGHSPQENPQ